MVSSPYAAKVTGISQTMVKSSGRAASDIFRRNYSVFVRFVQVIREEELGSKFSYASFADEIMDAFDLAPVEIKDFVGGRRLATNDIGKAVTIKWIRQIPSDETISLYTNWWNLKFRPKQPITPDQFILFLESEDMPQPRADRIIFEGGLFDAKNSYITKTEQIALADLQEWQSWIDKWYRELDERTIQPIAPNFEASQAISQIVQDRLIPPRQKIDLAFQLVLSALEDAENLYKELSIPKVTHYKIKEGKLPLWNGLLYTNQNTFLQMDDAELASHLSITEQDLALLRSGEIEAKGRSQEQVFRWLANWMRGFDSNPLTPNFFADIFEPISRNNSNNGTLV